MVVASLAAATACSRSQAATPPAKADRPVVAVARAERTDLSDTLTPAAEFRPFQEIDVHAKVAGYLKTIYVDVGDRVTAGQLLALLEVPELHDEARQDEATVQRSAAEVNRAEADLNRAESAHEVAHLASERLAGVLNARPNLIAQQDIDEAAARDRIAEAQAATAKAALAAAQQQLAASKAMANKTTTLLEYTRIVAPFNGVVTHRYADTGAMIQAGTSSQMQAMPVIRLSATDRLRLTIAVPESAVAHVQTGAPVEVRVGAVKRTFTGRIARFAGKVNPETRTMGTEVDVANPDLRRRRRPAADGRDGADVPREPARHGGRLLVHSTVRARGLHPALRGRQLDQHDDSGGSRARLLTSDRQRGHRAREHLPPPRNGRAAGGRG
jgi:multidrug efflux pump subunit AcrA (membrane-fusion protein)